MKAALLLAVLLAAGPAAAQAVGDCDGPAAGAQHVYAPFEATIRDFAGGAIRVTALDEGPDARGSGMMNRGAYHLMVTIRREDGAVTDCALVSAREGEGFFGMRTGEIAASEDAGITVINLPVDEVLGGDMLVARTLYLGIDPGAGTVQAAYEAPVDPAAPDRKETK